MGISIINYINNHCQLVDPAHAELRHLKSLDVDIVDCWWEIVETWTPSKHDLSG
jgi:hypothetical protein